MNAQARSCGAVRRGASLAMVALLMATTLGAWAPQASDANGSGGWSSRPPLVVPRVLPVLTVLPDGGVLALGGDPPRSAGRSYVTSAEVYDRQSGEWSPAAPPAVPRAEGFTATLLTGPGCGQQCGKVLVVGGRLPEQGPTDLAELYDPECAEAPNDAGEAQQVASACDAPSVPTRLTMARMGHTATVLGGPACVATPATLPSYCGKVLVVGGVTQEPAKPEAVTGTAELYDPVSGTWTPAGVLPAATGPRWGHTATPLPDGRVVMVGGSATIAGESVPSQELAEPPTAALYDPSESASPFKELPGPRLRRVPLRSTRSGALHTATALALPECSPSPPFVPCGRMLVTGGNQADIRTPWAEFLELTPERQELTVAADPQAAVTGGTFTLSFKGATTGDIAYNATADAVQSKLTALSTVGPRGAVAAGGPLPAMPIVVQFAGPLRDAGDQPEIVAKSALTVSEEARLAGMSAQVVVAEKLKGSNAWVPTGPAGQACPTDSTRTCRVQHTASPLPNGRVLVAGGRQGALSASPAIKNAEIFDATETTIDPASGATTRRGVWTAAGTATVARYDHTAVDLPGDDGKVVVVGGLTSGADSGVLAGTRVPTSSVEVFTPSAEPAKADLAVALAATPEPVAVGEQLTYEAIVSNHGPQRAAAPTIAVTLGARLVFESAEPSGICTLGAATGETTANKVQRVTCRLNGDMENEESATVTIKARVASNGGGTLFGEHITSSAQVSSATAEPSAETASNNLAIASTSVIAARNTADMALIASGPPNPADTGAFPEGREITHRLTVSNHGPDTAHGVTLEALVPSGATVNASVGATCTLEAIHVTCVIGSLALGATATLDVNVTTSAAHTGQVHTTGVVRASEIDPVPENNAASWSNDVRPGVSSLFNLKVDSITATPNPAIAGRRITYAIRARNDGPSIAPNVVLEDYPHARPRTSGNVSYVGGDGASAGFTGVSVKVVRPEGARCLVAPGGVNPAAGDNVSPGPLGVVRCAVGNLAPDANAEIEVQHDVPDSDCTVDARTCIRNIARVQSPALSSREPSYSDNIVEDVTPVDANSPAPPLDVWAMMADSPDPAAVGEDLKYTVQVGNGGPGPASSVTLEDPLPDAVLFKSANTTKGTCAVDNARTVECDIGVLAESEGATVEIVVVPQASSASTVSNVATVSSLEQESTPANNVARATTTVTTTKQSADLAVSVSDAPDPVTAGSDLTYTVRVVNHGPGTAYHAGVTDTLPAGVVHRSSSATRGGCGHDAGTVTCSFGHLDNGSEASATIVVRPTSPGTLTNRARVTSGNTDPTGANDSTTTQTTVDAAGSGSGTGGDETATTTTTTTSVTAVSTTTTPAAQTTTTPTQTTTTTTLRNADGASRSQGYTLVGSDGGVFNFGTSQFHGSTGGIKLNQPVIAVANKPGGTGYWLVAKDGGIFSFGDAQFFGSMGGKKLNAPILGMEPTPSGKGYYLFGEDGGIFAFGDARFHGSTGGHKLNTPVVALAVNEKGDGYWLVGGDGGIFAFGEAPFHGSTGGMRLNKPVLDMAATAADKGYWLVAEDGGVFSFGDAKNRFYGSAVGSTNSPVVGIGATPTFNGYWIADAKGAVFPFGDARFLGDRRNAANNAAIVGFATVPKT